MVEGSVQYLQTNQSVPEIDFFELALDFSTVSSATYGRSQLKIIKKKSFLLLLHDLQCFIKVLRLTMRK